MHREVCQKSKIIDIINAKKVQIKTKPKQNVFSCDQCQKEFATSYTLKRHKITRQSNIYVLSCEDCGEKFARKDNLSRHIENHHVKIFGSGNSIHFAEKQKMEKTIKCRPN